MERQVALVALVSRRWRGQAAAGQRLVVADRIERLQAGGGGRRRRWAFAVPELAVELRRELPDRCLPTAERAVMELGRMSYQKQIAPHIILEVMQNVEQESTRNAGAPASKEGNCN